ncbi:hypothetical protein quinque_011917 [Culex quinquefasciatus]
MEQEFYGLQIRSNFVHYHAFVALSVSAYCVCSYFLIIKACTMFLMIRYSALTYRLVAMRIRKLTRFSDAEDQSSAVEVSDLAEVVELHRLAYNLFNVMVLFWLSLIETFGYSYLGSQLM